MTEPRPERCVIVVDQALPPGLAGNAAAVLALSVGAAFSQLPGQDLVDADGSRHPGLIPMGLPVLAAPTDRLPDLRTAALDAGLHVVDFPAAATSPSHSSAWPGTGNDGASTALPHPSHNQIMAPGNCGTPSGHRATPSNAR